MIVNLKLSANITFKTTMCLLIICNNNQFIYIFVSAIDKLQTYIPCFYELVPRIIQKIILEQNLSLLDRTSSLSFWKGHLKNDLGLGYK